jgi:glycosyltransferase involved in cell wall biosynthesis
MESVKPLLFILPSTEIGGAETKLFELLKGFSGIKHALLTHAPLADYYSNLDVSIYTFEEHGCYEPLPVSLKKTFRYARAIAHTFRLEEYQCLLGIMHTGSFYVSVAKDLFRLSAPHIGTIEGPISPYFHTMGRSPTCIENSLLWYLLRRPSFLVVPSEGVKNDIASNFGIAEKKIRVIYNGIDIKKIQNTASENPEISDTYNGKTILTSCRLTEEKDFLTLLKAFNIIRSTVRSRLIIVGDGVLKAEIIRQAKDMGIERDIVLTGFQKNPFQYMKTADVFVLSSFFEGFGNVIVEAMALGVPVVATDCPSGPAEIIQHGISGLLVPVKDHEKMAAAAIQILTDNTKRNELSGNGLQRAGSFTVETMIENFRALLSDLSEGRGP